jgi:hypothetical protein
MRLSILAALSFLALAGYQSAHADPVLTPYVGANSISYNNNIASDFELGGGGSASLSPHISAVGSAWYGVGHTYLRGTIGARVTASDVNDPNFSIGIGGQYNASSKPDLRQEGWDGDVTLGWRPYPEKWPQAALVAQGAYMFSEPNNVYLMLGVRYALRPF